MLISEFYKSRIRKSLLAAIFIISGSIFTLRGPVRALRASDLNDLISPYTQAAAWVHGTDPYSPQSLFAFWPSGALSARPAGQEFSTGSILIDHGIPTAYPLTCFVLLGPFTVVPWHVIKFIFIASAVGLFFVSVWALISLARLQGWRRNMFIAGSLLLAPFHTGIAVFNLAVVATELGIIAIWANHRGKNISSGLLLALTVGLKPQVGLCFLLYFLVCRKWQPAIVSVAGIMAIASVAIMRLNMAHVHWLANYELDNRALFTSGVLGDFTERNPLRFGLVNLQVAFYPLLHAREATNIVALLLGTALLAACLILIIRTHTTDDLLFLSALAVLSLLPVYHRFYDAAVLIIPLSWLMARLSATATIRVGIGLTTIVAFFLPGGTLLQTLLDKGMLSSALTTNGWWNSLIMGHAAWCLLILALVLLYEISRSAKVETAHVKTEEMRVLVPTTPASSR
jgi:hypothetical protein